MSGSGSCRMYNFTTLAITLGWTSVRSTNSALMFSKAWHSFSTLLLTPETL